MIELWQALPPAVRTTLFIIAAAGGLLLGLYLLGRLLTLRRPDSALPLLLVVGGVVVLAGSVSLYLDAQPALPGVVESRSERIRVDDEGAWSHDLSVRVRYARPDTGVERSDDVGADPAVYDRVLPGDRVDVRFLHVGGLISFARLSNRSTFSMLLGAITNPTFVLMLAIAGLFALLWLLSTRPEWKAGFRTAFVLLFAVALVAQFLPQWRAAGPLRGRQATAVATVREVDRFTRVGGGDDSEPEELIQPFDLVQVSFVPAEWQGPVLAADIVDADSLSLEAGGTATVHYLVGHPRTIRLEGGGRSYAWKNVLWSMAKAAAVLVILVAYLFGRHFWQRLASRVPAK